MGVLLLLLAIIAACVACLFVLSGFATMAHTAALVFSPTPCASCTRPRKLVGDRLRLVVVAAGIVGAALQLLGIM